MIQFDVLTIFPEMFERYFSSSMLARAQKNKKIKIRVHNIRDYAKDKHKVTDDVAYGGISGMVMKVEPIYRAVESIKKKIKKGSPSILLGAERRKSRIVLPSSSKRGQPLACEAKRSNGRTVPAGVKTRVILLSAKGKILTQQKVRSLSKYEQIILIAGHYKGVDERVAKYVADEELSIGEYVITGGELPAMVVVDAVSRMIPGVIGKEASKEGESFSILGRSGLPNSRTTRPSYIKHEHAVYTRPEIFSPKRGVNWKVPKVLLSGDHKKIAEWREKNRKLK